MTVLPPTMPELTTAHRPRASGRRLSPQRRTQILWVVVVASGAAGMTAGARSTDLPVVDVALSGLFAGTATWCTAHARRWTWSWLAGVAAIAAVDRPPVLGLALGALLIALWSVRSRRRRRIAGALVGALAVQALMRLGDVGPLGVPTVVAAVALLPPVVSGYGNLPRRHKRRLRLGALAVVGVAVVASASAVVAVLLVRDRLEAAVDGSQRSVRGVEEAQRDQARGEARRARADFAHASRVLESPLLLPARGVPVVGAHLGAVREMADVGADLSGAAVTTLDDIDYDRLRYQSGRIDVDELEAVAGPVADVHNALIVAQQRTDEVDSPWLVAPVADRIEQLRGTIVSTRRDAATAQLAVDLAPGMLGAGGPRRYLVVFPTPSEMRPGGGFVGNYAILEADEGRLDLIESERIDSLISARPRGERSLEGLDEFVARYGQFQPEDYLQDLLWSPHFPWNAEAYAQLTEQSGRGEVDGVISMTPRALAAMVELTGRPARIQGREAPLPAAQVERWLQLDQYLEFEDDDVRADALEQLTEDTFDHLTTGSLPSPRRLADLLGPLVDTRDLQMYSVREGEQADLGRLGVTGEMVEADGHDLVHLTGTNGGNSKIDVFLHRRLQVTPTIDRRTGEVVSEVTVTIENRAPSEGLPEYVIGNARGRPPGTSRQLVSVHTPLTAEAVMVDGRVSSHSSSTERGYNVYGTYIDVPPGGTVTLELQLRGTIEGMSRYRLVVPAQTMVNPDRLVVDGPLVGRTRRLDLDRQRTVTAPRR